MPRYQNAVPFDIVRSVKNIQSDVKSLQVGASPSLVKKPLNAYTAGLNPNPFFWGMDPTGWEPTNGTFVVVSDPPDPSPYPYAGLYVNNGVSVGFMDEHDTVFVAQPGQSYQVSCYINTTSTSLTLGMNWFDPSLAPLTGPADAVITVTPNTWTQIDTILVAPASTAFATPQIGPTTADGSLTYFTAVTCMPVSPVPDTWHDMPAMSSSWAIGGGHAKYKLTTGGDLAFSFILQTPGTKTDGTAIWAAGSLPAAYRPGSSTRWPVSTTAAANSANSTPWMGFLTSGGLNINGINSAGALTEVHAAGVLPLGV